eukprot:UN26765
MEWMLPVDKSELQKDIRPTFGENPVEVKRFDFDGKIIDSKVSFSIQL